MKTGFSVDLILLAKFQKISNWVQERLGFDNFSIARILRIAMIIALIIREILSFIKGIDSTEIVVIVCSVMIIVKMDLIIRKGQQSVENNPAFKNAVVSEYAVTRVLIQFVGIAAFGFLIRHLYYIVNPSLNSTEQYDQCKEFFWDLFGMLMFFVAYFSSCTPNPYKPSKARKFIEKTGDRIRGSVPPSPAVVNL